MGLLSGISAAISKLAKGNLLGKATSGGTSWLEQPGALFSALMPAGTILKGAGLVAKSASPVLKPVAATIAKATLQVAKRPVAVLAGATVAGVASPGIGRKATGVGAATAIGGPVAGGIVAGLVGFDYLKTALTKTPQSIKTASTYAKGMGIRASGLANPSVYNVSETELTIAKQLDAELVSRTGAAGEYEWEVAGKRIGLHELMGTVENTNTPQSGVAPEVSAGLSGNLSPQLGNVLLPAIAGTALVGAGAYALSRRKKKKKTSKSSRKKTGTKRYTRQRTSRRRVGSAKQYRKAGGKTVHYTKHGQPYIKLRSGKARFIKK